jgi:hypothetical protein
MKEKVNYILIVVAVAVVLGAFYLLKDKKPVEVVEENNTPTQTATSTEYKNSLYGFKVALPKSWEGFEVIGDIWEGYSLTDGGQSQKITETGPYFYIRHPKWTEDEPRQDIPVMVFTFAQWSDLENDIFHIGAAPFGPTELTRNKTYIFALPARYNYAFPTGFEEVQDLIDAGAVKAL